MTKYSAAERAAIARGEFFTPSELARRPWLGRSVLQSAVRGTPLARRDPNDAPVSAEAKALAETNGVCDYCHEPSDNRSKITGQGDGRFRHPECQEALDSSGR